MVRCHSNHSNHSRKHNSNHLSVHQRIRSAIRDSQQPTSPIGFVFLKLPPCAVLLLLILYDTYIYICVCACISYIIFGVYASKQYVYSAYVYITQLYVIWCCMYICIQSVTEKIHLDSKTLSRTAGLRGRMGQPIQIRNKRPMCRRQCPEINSRIGPRKNIWPKECSGLSLQWLDYCRTKTIRVPNLEQLRSC